MDRDVVERPLPHEYDEDACCIYCGFDGAEWSHWKRSTYEGRASDEKAPLCNRWAPQRTGSLT